MRRARLLSRVAALGVASLAGCASYDLARADIEALCAEWNGRAGAAVGVRRETTVTMRGPSVDGEYLGVLVARRAPLAVRLQLFPELGGKILDLVATPERQVGELPATGQRLDRPGGTGRDPLLHMFAIALLEVHAPLHPDRVLGGWRGGAAGGAVHLDLQPRYGESGCSVELDPGSGDRTFRIGSGGWRFTLRTDAAGAVEVRADVFVLRAVVAASEDLDAVDEGLFELREPPAR